MLHLHANVFAQPTAAVAGPTATLRGLELPTLVGAGGGPPVFDRTMPVAFEEMQRRLLELPRSDCEPDGFFLITGGRGADFWRLNGHMFELDSSMHRVELNGECPEASLDAVLRTMGWPDTELVFELVQEGVTLNEAAFRVWVRAGSAGSAGVEDDPARTGLARAGSSSTPAQPTSPQTNAPLPPPRAITSWHITFGTYGTRLHGDARPTVDREHNQFGAPFVTESPGRQQHERNRMRFPPVRLTTDQREFIEQTLPAICERGGWRLRACAAASDHVHVVCDIPVEIHGEKVRRLMKRWLTQALNQKWPLAPGARWWAEQGSNKAIKDEAYLRNAIAYVERQRTVR